MSGALVGCANISDSYQASLEDYKQYEEITKQYNVKKIGGRHMMMRN